VNLGEFMQPEFLSIEGEDSDDWMCLDCGSCIVHCFTAEGREQYDLEGYFLLFLRLF
jgi:ribosomal silencing factor RsfS